MQETKKVLITNHVEVELGQGSKGATTDDRNEWQVHGHREGLTQ